MKLSIAAILLTLFSLNAHADCASSRKLLNGNFSITVVEGQCIEIISVQITNDCKAVRLDSRLESAPGGNCQMTEQQDPNQAPVGQPMPIDGKKIKLSQNHLWINDGQGCFNSISREGDQLQFNEPCSKSAKSSWFDWFN